FFFSSRRRNTSLSRDWSSDVCSSDLGPERGETVRLILLGGHALALGLQSSTVQRFGAGGLSTTYLTGTLTGLVVRLATGGGVRSVGRNAALLLGLIGGAALGAVLTAKAWALAPLTQL